MSIKISRSEGKLIRGYFDIIAEEMSEKSLDDFIEDRRLRSQDIGFLNVHREDEESKITIPYPHSVGDFHGAEIDLICDWLDIPRKPIVDRKLEDPSKSIDNAPKYSILFIRNFDQLFCKEEILFYYGHNYARYEIEVFIVLVDETGTPYEVWNQEHMREMYWNLPSVRDTYNLDDKEHVYYEFFTSEVDIKDRVKVMREHYFNGDKIQFKHIEHHIFPSLRIAKNTWKIEGNDLYNFIKDLEYQETMYWNMFASEVDLKIKNAIEAGHSQTHIAKELGMSKSTISRRVTKLFAKHS